MTVKDIKGARLEANLVAISIGTLVVLTIIFLLGA